MADWTILKSSITSIIRANGNQEITGTLLQNAILSIISALGENATFIDIATLGSNPGTYDGPVFYLAAETGIYPNFNNIEALPGELTCMIWRDSQWKKKSCKVVEIVNDLISGGQNKALSAEMGKSLNNELIKLYSFFSDSLQDLQAKTEDLPDIRSTIISLGDSIQNLQDETEDLQSMRDTIDMLGTDKADKSALEATDKEVAKKQNKLANYEEVPSGKTTIKYPNGTARVEVSNARAALWANDDKVAIAADANGTRMLYNKTAEDGSIEHRDEISIGKHDDNSATHITLTSKSTTEDTGEKITNTSTIQVTPDSISMSSPSGEINDVVKEIIDKLDASAIINDLTTGGTDKALSAEMGKTLSEELASKASSESVSNLRQEVDAKAPKSGYAPDLKVNFAKELVGRGESTDEVIGGIRPTGVRSIGDGNATITKIKGESVVWNQHVNMGADITAYGLTFSAYGLGGVRISGTPTQQAGDVRITLKKKPATVGHKILAKSNAQGISICCQGSNVYNGISTATDTTLLDLVVSFNFPTDTAVDLVFYPEIVDLTRMFTAGNEPTTIEDFEARKPLNVTNEYNEGTIVSYNGDALKSVGFNALDCDRILVKESGKQPTSSRIWDYDKVYYPAASNGHVISSYSVENIVITPELIQATCGSAWYGLAFPIPLIGGAEYEFTYSSLIGRIAIMYLDKEGKHTSNFSLDRNKPFIAEKDKQAVFLIVPTTNGQTISVTNPCFHLVHSGYRNGEYKPYEADIHPLPDVKSILDADGNQLFPNGLLSAGSVHDEITATKAIKRIGVVDMGTLNWSRFAETDIYIFQVTPAGIGVYSDTTSVPNLLSKVYSSVLRADIKTTDKCISQNNGAKALIIRDDAYTDVTSFKAAMSGVLLYYELAEPIEVDLQEPLNMTYEAWDFGTEELIADSATTPLNADIVYQFNAVDRIRENSSAIDALEEHVEERKDDGIELLTNGNLELTLKGETREFMPATPSGDPMHWAYVSAGAEYNDTGADITKTGVYGDTITHKAGYWYLNEIGDLSNQEIAEIYSERWPSRSTPIAQYFWGVKSRTACIGLSPSSAISNYLFYHCYNMEKLKLTNDTSNLITLSLTTIASIIYLSSLTKILTILKANNTTAFNSWFDGCVALEEVRISALKCDISFKHCSNISKTSVKYMIDNAIPTSAITITLHHDAYERLKGDADILQALTTKNADLANTGDGKGKVSLVCATDNNTIPSE